MGIEQNTHNPHFGWNNPVTATTTSTDCASFLQKGLLPYGPSSGSNRDHFLPPTARYQSDQLHRTPFFGTWRPEPCEPEINPA